MVYDPRRLPVNAGIELLDRAGMDLIEAQDVDRFRAYLEQEQNTICGQHPICVLLETMRASKASQGPNCRVQFLNYSQSSELPVGPGRDVSCVSYASAVVVAS
jgi:AmmeMemoRadiSam system protein B